MLVSTSSWHYKLVKWFSYHESEAERHGRLGVPYEWEPISSCQYLRTLALIVLIPMPVIVVGLTVLAPLIGLFAGIAFLGKKVFPANSERERRDLQRAYEKRQSLFEAWDNRAHLICTKVEYEREP